MKRAGTRGQKKRRNRSSRTAISYSRVASCFSASSLLSAMMFCSNWRTAISILQPMSGMQVYEEGRDGANFAQRDVACLPEQVQVEGGEWYVGGGEENGSRVAVLEDDQANKLQAKSIAEVAQHWSCQAMRIMHIDPLPTSSRACSAWRPGEREPRWKGFTGDLEGEGALTGV